MRISTLLVLAAVLVSGCVPPAVRPNYELQREAMSAMAASIAEGQLQKESGGACVLLDLSYGDGVHRDLPLSATWRDILEEAIVDRGLFVLERDPSVVVAILDEGAEKSYQREIRVDELSNATTQVEITAPPVRSGEDSDGPPYVTTLQVPAPLSELAITKTESSVASKRTTKLDGAAFVIAYRIYDVGIQYTPARSGFVRRRAEAKAYAKLIDPATGRVVWSEFVSGEVEDEISRVSIPFAERSPLVPFNAPMPLIPARAGGPLSRASITPSTRPGTIVPRQAPMPKAAVTRPGPSVMSWDVSLGYAHGVWAYEEFVGGGISGSVRGRYAYGLAVVRAEKTKARTAMGPEVGARIPILANAAITAMASVGFGDYRYVPVGDPNATLRVQQVTFGASSGVEFSVARGFGIRGAVGFEHARDAWIRYEGIRKSNSDLQIFLARAEIAYEF